jgi:hypothetical protein
MAQNSWTELPFKDIVFSIQHSATLKIVWNVAKLSISLLECKHGVGGRRFNYRTRELKEVVWWDIHSTNTQEEEDSTIEL